MKWVKEVDGNSEFFHRVVNGRHNRKYIEVLENKEGTLLDNIDSISKETLHFFEKLYKNPPRESWRLEGFRLGTHFSRECYLVGTSLYRRRDSQSHFSIR